MARFFLACSLSMNVVLWIVASDATTPRGTVLRKTQGSRLEKTWLNGDVMYATYYLHLEQGEAVVEVTGKEWSRIQVGDEYGTNP